MDPVQEDAKKELHDVFERLGKLDTTLGEGREEQAKLTAAITSLSEKIGTPSQRRGAFDPADAERELESAANDGPSALINARVRGVARDDETRRLHEVNDQLMILGAALKKDPRNTRLYRSAFQELDILKRSLDTGGSSLGPWVPTIMSGTLHEQVRLALRVSSLFENIDMPQDPYALPIEGSDAESYIVSQQGDADADIDANKRVPASLSGSNQPGASVLTLTTTKIGTRVVFSEEAEEDAIIPILPYLTRKVRLALAYQEEDADINGDTTATHMDSDVTAATDGRKAWKGLRKLTLAGTKVSNTASSVTKIALNDLRTVRQKMGKYGLFPEDVVFVTGAAGAMKMLAVEDPMAATNPSPVVTVDKMGPNATILKGQIASIDGIPIIVSPKVREDLDQNGIKLSSGTNDRTLVLCVNKAAFVKGTRRQVKLVSQYIPTTDQTMLVALRRLTFACWFASDPVVGQITNIKL
jgi:HK97 family phage major capsid protein